MKGDVLRGRVVQFGTERVEFETTYGTGVLSIAYDDIEDLDAHDEYVVLHGESFETSQGRVVGFDAGEVLITAETKLPKSATTAPAAPIERIPVTEIKRAVRADDFEHSLLTRLRTRYSHWRADLDVGFTLEEGAVDERKITTTLEMRRRKERTRLYFDFTQAFETQEKSSQPRTTTKNELFGSVRFEYDLGERLRSVFAFGVAGGEWDKPRGITWRTFPSAGLGYRILDSETVELQLMGGFGVVAQKFQGFDDEHWAAGVLGGSFRWSLPLDAELSGGLFFMPRLDGSSWLYRSGVVLTVPVWDPLTLRFRVTEVNDNTPEPGVGNNKLTTTLGFGLRF